MEDGFLLTTMGSTGIPGTGHSINDCSMMQRSSPCSGSSSALLRGDTQPHFKNK